MRLSFVDDCIEFETDNRSLGARERGERRWQGEREGHVMTVRSIGGDMI